jgi:anti-sigma B factor antagonist
MFDRAQIWGKTPGYMLDQAREDEQRFEVRVRASKRGSPRVVQVIGEVDVFSARLFKAALTRELDHGNYSVIVDLTRVDYMDSTGLGVLVAAFKRAREHQGTITLVGLNRQLTKIFDMTGLNRVFDIRESV